MVKIKNVFVCGSIAFDHIMDFPGLFKDYILPEKIHALSVSFLVSSLQKMRGGTAPNIAYNLALVGEKPFIVGTAGKDFIEYQNWLEDNGVNTKHIRTLNDDFTASCFITTDLTNNQITGFYPGAMSRDPEISLKDIDLKEISMVVIAPTEPAAMTKWAEECQELKMPYLFDPGMQIPRLSQEDLTKGIIGSSILVLNDYEYSLTLEKTGFSKEDILDKVDLLVITLGEQGSILSNKNQTVQVSAAKAIEIVDPTGAGDAYRAGLLKGYFEKVPLEVMGRYGSVSAVYAVEHKGGTGHKYTIDEFYKRYNDNFGGM